MGAFDDSESVLEYFFARVATPNSRVTQTTIRKLTSPHAGKTGGMMCIDFSYESFWDEDYQ